MQVVNRAPTPQDLLDRNMFQYLRYGLPVKVVSRIVAQAYHPDKRACLDYLAYKQSHVMRFRSQVQLPDVCWLPIRVRVP